MSTNNFAIAVAPMMDWTDRHCRHFHRLLAPEAWLYTEMITTGALLHGDAERFLRFDSTQHPVVLQLGGSDPDGLARAAAMGQEAGYDAINLNCGCPSDRVQGGNFGACLMKTPDHVARSIAAMIRAVDIPVTVKCRIGVDDSEDGPFLDTFVEDISASGCKTFIIHARKAWLQGLSPKENREVPPLDYARVHALKAKYPHLEIHLNGGLKTVGDIRTHAAGLDGAMIGREAYHNPWMLTELSFLSSRQVEPQGGETQAGTQHKNERSEASHPLSGSRITAQPAASPVRNDTVMIPTRRSVALAMMDYARAQKEQYGTPVKSITRHILGLYHGRPRARLWRQVLSTRPYEDGADERVILEALEVAEPALPLETAA